MTLVFDENLSARLPARLTDCFPAATHVEQIGLQGEDDLLIWNRAKGLATAIIVSKDDDFRELALAYGPPPKVLMLIIGNCSTSDVEHLLRANCQLIMEFAADKESALLEIFL